MKNYAQPELDRTSALVCLSSCWLNTPFCRLYIPAFWWHQVTSVEQAISVNMFWGDAGTNTYLTKIMVRRIPSLPVCSFLCVLMRKLSSMFRAFVCSCLLLVYSPSTAVSLDGLMKSCTNHITRTVQSSDLLLPPPIDVTPPPHSVLAPLPYGTCTLAFVAKCPVCHFFLT